MQLRGRVGSCLAPRKRGSLYELVVPILVKVHRLAVRTGSHPHPLSFTGLRHDQLARGPHQSERSLDYISNMYILVMVQKS
jgi:hypothetical protein